MNLLNAVSILDLFEKLNYKVDMIVIFNNRLIIRKGDVDIKRNLLSKKLPGVIAQSIVDEFKKEIPARKKLYKPVLFAFGLDPKSRVYNHARIYDWRNYDPVAWAEQLKTAKELLGFDFEESDYIKTVAERYRDLPVSE